MFFKIGVLKNIALFAGKHLCWSLLLIKLQAATLLKRHFINRTLLLAACRFSVLLVQIVSESFGTI